MAGQVAVAVAQPVILSAIGRLAGEYLTEGDRANGIAVGSAGNFVGMLVALGLGPALGGHGHLQRLLAVEAVLAVIPVLGLAWALRRPGHATEERAAIAGGAARALWKLPELRTLCSLVFLGFGIFVALATWLQTLLHPDGVSETDRRRVARRRWSWPASSAAWRSLRRSPAPVGASPMLAQPRSPSRCC